MPKVKLSFTRLSIPERLSRAQKIVESMTGNPNFPAPQPTLAQISAAVNDLQATSIAAQKARQEAKTATSEQETKEDVLDQLITQLGGHVESISGDDETKILSAGM